MGFKEAVRIVTKPTSRAIMNLSSLGRADLILIFEELGVEGVRYKTKALIIEAIRATGADAAKLAASLELAKDRQREKLKERERSDRIGREELEKRRQQIELRKLDLEFTKCQTKERTAVVEVTDSKYLATTFPHWFAYKWDPKPREKVSRQESVLELSSTRMGQVATETAGRKERGEDEQSDLTYDQRLSPDTTVAVLRKTNPNPERRDNESGVEAAEEAVCQGRKTEAGDTKVTGIQRVSTDATDAVPRKTDAVPYDADSMLEALQVGVDSGPAKEREEASQASGVCFLGDKDKASMVTPPGESIPLKESSAEKSANREAEQDSGRSSHHPWDPETKPGLDKRDPDQGYSEKAYFSSRSSGKKQQYRVSVLRPAPNDPDQQSHRRRDASSQRRKSSRPEKEKRGETLRKDPSAGIGCKAKGSSGDTDEPSLHNVHPGRGPAGKSHGSNRSSKRKRKRRQRKVSVLRSYPNAPNDKRRRTLDDGVSSQRQQSSRSAKVKQKGVRPKDPPASGGCKSKGSSESMEGDAKTETTPKESSQLLESGAEMQEVADQQSSQDADRSNRHSYGFVAKPTAPSLESKRLTRREVIEISFNKINQSCLVRLRSPDSRPFTESRCKENIDDCAFCSESSSRLEDGRPQVGHPKGPATGGGCAGKGPPGDTKEPGRDKAVPMQLHLRTSSCSRHGGSEKENSEAVMSKRPRPKRKRQRRIRFIRSGRDASCKERQGSATGATSRKSGPRGWEGENSRTPIPTSHKPTAQVRARNLEKATTSGTAQRDSSWRHSSSPVILPVITSEREIKGDLRDCNAVPAFKSKEKNLNSRSEAKSKQGVG